MTKNYRAKKKKLEGERVRNRMVSRCLTTAKRKIWNFAWSRVRRRVLHESARTRATNAPRGILSLSSGTLLEDEDKFSSSRRYQWFPLLVVQRATSKKRRSLRSRALQVRVRESLNYYIMFSQIVHWNAAYFLQVAFEPPRRHIEDDLGVQIFLLKEVFTDFFLILFVVRT